MIVQPPKTRLRYVHEAAGAFVLITLAGLLLLFGLAGRAQRWFEPVDRIRVILPREGSFGLREGADVQLLGTVVGSVDRLTITQDEIAAVLWMRREFAEFVRSDSRAVIRRTFGVAGDAYLEITRGFAEPTTEAFVLVAVADQAPTETLQLVIDQIRNEAIPAVQAIRKAAEEYTTLAEDLGDPSRPLQRAIASLDSIAGKVDRGEGLVGRLVGDAEFAQNTRTLLERATVSIDGLIDLLGDIRLAAASLKTISQRVEGQSDALPELVEQVRGVLRRTDDVLSNLQTIARDGSVVSNALAQEAQALPGLAVQAHETMRELERLIEAIERHWLIREYVESPARRPRLAPSAAGLAPPSDAASSGAAREAKPAGGGR